MLIGSVSIGLRVPLPNISLYWSTNCIILSLSFEFRGSCSFVTDFGDSYHFITDFCDSCHFVTDFCDSCHFVTGVCESSCPGEFGWFCPHCTEFSCSCGNPFGVIPNALQASLDRKFEVVFWLKNTASVWDRRPIFRLRVAFLKHGSAIPLYPCIRTSVGSNSTQSSAHSQQ